jgi:uncharacterized protein YjbI with pentapeptide repeats
MNDVPSFPPLDNHSRYDPIDLEDKKARIDFGKEVYRKVIKGTAQNLTAGSFQNVIESIFDGTSLLNCDFSNTDFKDCVFKFSKLEKCRLDILTFATNTLSDCQFTQCTFSNSTFQNCIFQRVRFSSCDFSKLLVKECRFIDCIFDKCNTSNKLLEMCLLINTRFHSTDIQVDTILSNFGITASHLQNSRIRSGRTDSKFTFIEMEHIRDASKNAQIAIPALINIRLDFFENGNLLVGSEGLDQSLEIETWMHISSNLGSFLQVYRSFTDFLVLLYENDFLYWHSILRLHDLSGSFVKNCDGLPFETTTTLMGIHQRLSIYVEDIFLLAESIADKENRHLEFIVEGPTDNHAVRTILSPLFESAEAPLITRLQPRNSPWQLGLDFLSHHQCFRALILLLATRARCEIRKIENQNATTTSKGTRQKHQKNNESTSVAIFDAGFIRGSHSVSGYGLSVLIPGRRIAELQLGFDSKKLSKMAAFLVALDLTK